ncbi:Ig-like domain-containing protein [Fibrobacterota bacterium]
MKGQFRYIRLLTMVLAVLLLGRAAYAIDTLSHSVGHRASYNAGTAAVSADGLTVTISGGTINEAWGLGDNLTVDGETRYVKTRVSSTVLTLQSASSKTSQSGLSYSIARAYTTMEAWETGQNRDLVAADEIAQAVMRSDGTYHSTFKFFDSEFTSDVTRHIWVYVPPSDRHEGRKDNGAVIDAGGINGIELQYLNYVVWEGLSVKGGTAGWYLRANNGGKYINCMAYDNSGWGILAWGGGTEAQPHEFYNCVVINSSKPYVFDGDGANNYWKLYNCISIRATNNAFWIAAADAGPVELYNCYAALSANKDYWAEYNSWTAFDSCASADATGSSTALQSIAFSTSTGGMFTNVTVGSEDPTINLGSALIDQGVNLSGILAYDFLDSARPSGQAWDIGAHEFPAPPPIITGLDAAATLNAAQTDSGPVAMQYEVTDYNGDSVTITGEQQIKDGGGWVAMTDTSGEIDRVDTNNSGVDRIAYWDVHEDLGTATDTQYTVRLIVTDDYTPALKDTVTSAEFLIDTKDPTGLANFDVVDSSIDYAIMTWDTATENHFSHYEIWYGTQLMDVQQRAGDAVEWDDDNDGDLADITEDTTTVTGLMGDTKYYFQIWAVDSAGNEMTTAADTVTTLTTLFPQITGWDPASQISAAQYNSDSVRIGYEVWDSDDATVNVTLQVKKKDDGSWTEWASVRPNVDGDTGTVTVSKTANDTIIWDIQDQFGDVDTVVYVRIIATDDDPKLDTATSDSFKVDTKPPQDLASFSVTDSTTSTMTLEWTAASDNNFSHYEIWYGTNQTFVQNRSGAAEWDDDNYAAMATAATDSTAITGLSRDVLYYFKIWAVDSFWNDTSLADISHKTAGTLILYPDGDGSESGCDWETSEGSTFFDLIDEGMTSADDAATYIQSAARQDGFIWIRLSDTWDDFSSATSAEIRVRHREPGSGNDRATLDYQVVEGNSSSTGITLETDIGQLPDNGAYQNDSETVSIDGTNTKEAWDAAFLRINYDYTRNAPGDDAWGRITAVEVALGVAADETSPTVESFNPADEDTIGINDNLVITFDENVDAVEDSIWIKKSSDSSVFESFYVASTKVTGSGTTVITINPSGTFDYSTRYFVQISASAFDDVYDNGYAGLDDSTTWNFYTEPDAVAPTALSFYPVDNADDMGATDSLVIIFSEDVDAETDSIWIKLASDSSTFEAFDVTGAKVTNTPEDTIVIDPAGTLTGGASYFVQVSADAFDDAGGNSYAGISDAISWNFTVTDAAATETPTLTTPATNSDDDATVAIDFTLPEAGSDGTVKLIFTRTGGVADGGSPHILVVVSEASGQHVFTLDGTDMATGTAEIGSVESGGSALVYGTVYSVTIKYQDVDANPADSAVNTSFFYTQLEAKWKRTGLGAIQGGAMGATAIYVGTGGSVDSLFSISLYDGSSNWSFYTGTYGDCSMPTFIFADSKYKIVAGAGTYVVGRQDDGSSSSELFSPKDFSATVGTPYIPPDDDSTYVVAYTNKVTRYDFVNDSIMGSSWPVTVTNISLAADPVVSSDKIYVATTDNYVKSYDWDGTNENVSADLGAAINLPLLINGDGSALFVTPASATLYALNASNLTTTDSENMGDASSGAAFMTGQANNVYVAAQDSIRKYAWNGSAFTWTWSFGTSATTINSGAVISSSKVYFGDDSGDYWAFTDVATPDTVSTWPYTASSDNANAGPWISEDSSMVVFGTDGGDLDAFALE